MRVYPSRHPKNPCCRRIKRASFGLRVNSKRLRGASLTGIRTDAGTKLSRPAHHRRPEHPKGGQPVDEVQRHRQVAEFERPPEFTIGANGRGCRGPVGHRHTGRGSQYAAEAYRKVLAEHGLVGSMGRRGNPYDNAKAESFMK
ncbi:hypothetical protein MFUR16E_03080 [Methylobacterium fujisawaense]